MYTVRSSNLPSQNSESNVHGSVRLMLFFYLPPAHLNVVALLRLPLSIIFFVAMFQALQTITFTLQCKDLRPLQSALLIRQSVTYRKRTTGILLHVRHVMHPLCLKQSQEKVAATQKQQPVLHAKSKSNQDHYFWNSTVWPINGGQICVKVKSL